MKKLILLIICLISFSCKKENNIEIKNKTLENEITSLISRINKNKPCKSDNIMVQFEETKIYISNAKPILSRDLIGVCTFKKSKIYFYSNNDNYKNYINVELNNNNFIVDEKYSSNCEPPIGTTLIIDENNKYNLIKWKLK